MMKRYYSIPICVLLVLLFSEAQGQRNIPKQKQPAKTVPAAPRSPSPDTTIKSATLEVYQIYKPEIKVTPKPEFTPTLPPPDKQPAPQEYEVPQQTLFYTYRSLPLHPLALGKDTSPMPFANYMKLGGGNLSTIYGEAGIGNLHGNGWDAAVHAHHISQEGNIQGEKFRHSGLEATGSLHRNGFLWEGAIDAQLRRYGLYGFDHDLHNYSDDQIRRNYTGIGVSVGAQNEQAGFWGMNYHPVISASLYTSNVIDAERTIDISLPFSRQIDTGLVAQFGIRGLFTKLTADSFSEGNNIFQLTPGVHFHQGDFEGNLGIYPTFGRNGNTYLLPDITASFQFLKSRFHLNAGWQASLSQNTFAQLTLKNPFLAGPQDIPQTRTDEVFFMLQSHVGPHLSFSGRVSWWQYNNLPLFLTVRQGDGKDFYLINDPRVNAISLQATARYQIADLLSLGVSGTWYNYYHTTYDHVWHEPAIRMKADLQWQLLHRLQVSAYTSVLDEIYTINQEGEMVKLKGILDIGGGAEYSFIPRLSLFLNVNNLLNQHSERWLGYSSFGLNIYGGLRLRF